MKSMMMMKTHPNTIWMCDTKLTLPLGHLELETFLVKFTWKTEMPPLAQNGHLESKTSNRTTTMETAFEWIRDWRELPMVWKRESEKRKHDHLWMRTSIL